MRHELVQFLRFVALWSLATTVGIFIGTVLGANSIGLVQGSAGDFLFGLSIGCAQWAVLRSYMPEKRRALVWMPASAFSFPAGVIAGARVINTFDPDDLFWLQVCFGIGMGLAHGMIQLAALRVMLPTSGWWVLVWLPTALVGWIVTEVVSLGVYYSYTLALPVGLTLGILTSVGGWFILKRKNP